MLTLTAVAALIPAATPLANEPAAAGGLVQDGQGDLASRVAALEAANRELERQLDVLADDVETVDLGGLFTPVTEGTRGLSPAASKIYFAENPLSIGGYGEMLYDNVQGGSDELDFLRAILYVGYKFNDQWLLNTEFEFEHATVADNNDGSGDESPGSVSVEFAYLEYLATEHVSFRAGLLLIPMGFVNELHEPTTFFSANRPEIERRIIPSTWRENGIGVTGNYDDFEYRVYIVNGLDAEGFSDNGLRGGRQKGGQAVADDWALVARGDYTGTEGLYAGISAYYGGSGQDNGVGTVTTTILDAHVQYEVDSWRFRGLYAMADLDDTDSLNATFGNDVGSEMSGFYLEAGYDLLADEEDQSLIPFVRYEEFDTQEGDLLGGAAEAPARDRESWTLGVAYYPTSQVVLKADYVDRDNEAGSAQDLFRLAIGYIF